MVAAQLISEVVSPCSSAHMDKLGSEECPVSNSSHDPGASSRMESISPRACSRRLHHCIAHRTNAGYCLSAACYAPAKSAAQLARCFPGPSSLSSPVPGDPQVCLQSEGDWSLLPCGHAICNPCLAQLVKAQARAHSHHPYYRQLRRRLRPTDVLLATVHTGRHVGKRTVITRGS